MSAINPEFLYLLDQYQQHVDQGLDRTDEARKLFGGVARKILKSLN